MRTELRLQSAYQWRVDALESGPYASPGIPWTVDVETRPAATGGLELFLHLSSPVGVRIPFFHAVWLPAELGEIVDEHRI